MNDEDVLITSIGTRVKELRYAAGFTQEAMAVRIGCGLRNYQRLESGQINMSLRTLARLAVALGVDPIELFTRVPLLRTAHSSVTIDRPRANSRRQRK